MRLLNRATRLYSFKNERGDLFNSSHKSVLATFPAVREAFRSHLTHHHPGGAGGEDVVSPTDVGPRTPYVTLGLEASKHTGNILRLLESSHQNSSGVGGGYLSLTGWHAEKGQRWTATSKDDDDDDVRSVEWSPSSPDEQSKNVSTESLSSTTEPRLESVRFADERTALVKLVGADATTSYLSLLKLDVASLGTTTTTTTTTSSYVPNDGWTIVREVVAATTASDDRSYESRAWDDLFRAIRAYRSIEHGGGTEDAARAAELFHPRARLTAVGTERPGAVVVADEWTAPVGELVDVSLDAYLVGVESQRPHRAEASRHDALTSVDVVAGGRAAAVALTVGNGARTTLFRDHLLLGRRGGGGESSSWQILCKTFSPQPWPSR